MATKQVMRVLMLVSMLYNPADAMIEGLYCGADSCYSLLDITFEATKTEITKSYRKLARKWHPDMHKGEEAKAEAQKMFQKIANAYEILRDEEQRSDYDYYLDHPEEYYSHYYRYYSRRMAPKIDIRIVLAVTITIISGIQYWSAWNNYHQALTYLVTVPKYRLQATEIAKQEGLLGAKRKKDRSKTKDEIREEEEEILKKVVAENMDIRGSYSKPTVYDILWLQLLFSPYYLALYVWWWLRWVWFFWILKRNYGDEEKNYIIRRNMKMSSGQWESLDEHERDEFMDQELWLSENFKVWKANKEEELKIEMATSSRYKSYRRYMKKGGPGQMQFGPD